MLFNGWIMVNKSTEKRPRKVGSGRKKGSKSFTQMAFAELSKICGQETVIPVSRVWLEQMGVKIVSDDHTNLQSSSEQLSQEPQNKIQFNLTK